MQIDLIARLAAAQVVCLGSATLSAAYYASWAPSLTAAVALGVLAGALDLVKPQLFSAAAEAAGEGSRGRAWGAGLLACLLAVISMIAVDGMLLKLRTDTSGGRSHEMGTWDRAKAAFDRAEAELAALGAGEPKAALEARLESSVDVTVWRRTAKCTDVTRAGSQDACKPAFAIREQIAMAERAAALERARDDAKAVLDSTQRPASADAQVELVAKAASRFGMGEAEVLLALTWLAGLGLELVACFGPWLLTGRRAQAAAEAPQGTPEQQALRWVLGELAKSGGKLAVLNTAIAARFDVDPATATRWRQRWVDDGLIAEERHGRQIVLSLAR